jgi:hypothetical protein
MCLGELVGSCLCTGIFNAGGNSNSNNLIIDVRGLARLETVKGSLECFLGHESPFPSARTDSYRRNLSEYLSGSGLKSELSIGRSGRI